MKNIKKFFLIIFLFFAYFIFSAFNYTNAVTKDLSDSIFRLHVIANSDSVEDQNLKYKVRDNALEYMNSITNSANSKKEIISIISSNLNDFKTVAQNTIWENGYDYDVSVEIGNYLFPTKTYGDISFPSGYYDALRIKIGSAQGKNWWCVMFPPLCFIDVSSGIVPDESKEMLESELTTDEYNLISENSDEAKVKFKIVEVLQNLKFSGIFM